MIDERFWFCYYKELLWKTQQQKREKEGNDAASTNKKRGFGAWVLVYMQGQNKDSTGKNEPENRGTSTVIEMALIIRG